MIEKLVQSLFESVKRRNTSDAYITDAPGDNLIHRGYIRNATVPIKYEFMPSENQKSKNEGKHIYRFGDKKSLGFVIAKHRVNQNQNTGHETTSTISYSTVGFDDSLSLQRILIPAVIHHINSHDPDIIKFKNGFKYLKELMTRIDPDGKKFTLTKKETGVVVKKTTPLDAKARRVIDHIKKSINSKRKKEINYATRKKSSR